MSWSDARCTRRALLLGAVLAPAGCGFRLRGSAALGFRTLALAGDGGPLRDALRRRIEATTSTRVVADPKHAQAVLTLLQIDEQQVPVAYNADGTVAQYQLIERVRYRLTAASGSQLIAPTTLQQTSTLSYSTGAALAKANEAQLLYHGMREDLIERMLFQLAAVGGQAR